VACALQLPVIEPPASTPLLASSAVLRFYARNQTTADYDLFELCHAFAMFRISSSIAIDRLPKLKVPAVQARVRKRLHLAL
jgi:hypothetical protein